jgi:rhodanese-related sulfurtransferase
LQLNTYIDISLDELEAIAAQANAVVIDVREPWEFEEFNIGGLNIPLADIRGLHQRYAFACGGQRLLPCRIITK